MLPLCITQQSANNNRIGHKSSLSLHRFCSRSFKVDNRFARHKAVKFSCPQRFQVRQWWPSLVVLPESCFKFRSIMETIFMPFRRLALTYGDFYGDPHNEVEHVGSAKASKIAPPGSEPAGAHSKNGLSSRDTRGDHQPAWSERTKTSSTLLSCGGPHKYLKPAIIDSTELLTASTRAPSTTEARVAYLTPKLRSKSDSSAIRPTSSINDTFVASEPIPFPKLRSKSDSFSYRPTSDFSEGGTSLSNDYHLSERIRAMDNGTLKRSKSQNAIHPPSVSLLTYHSLDSTDPIEGYYA